MNTFEHLLINDRLSIHKVIEKLDNNDAHIIFVVDENKKLLGTITDGDVRRGILRGVELSAPANQIMNAQPIVVQDSDSKEKIFSLMKKNVIRQIPILNKAGQLVDVEILEDVINFNRKDNTVVLMAGGLSTRLRPLTENIPKPMLKIGGKPILETILTNLIQSGFHKFYISINYLGDQIRDYFGNGSRWDIDIQYLQENEKMGTAGSLSLIKEKLVSPFIVMNSDLLTKVDFNHLLSFHKQHDSDATMSVRAFDYTVPYGTCKLENNRILDVMEKPTYKFFINAGVYVLNPKILSLIPENNYLDMPNLFSKLIRLKKEVTAFPIREYWLDIGQMNDFEKAHEEYSHIFETT